ncbi:MAG: hypothetical protein ABI972_30805 [Acidobacteriota bacterium]
MAKYKSVRKDGKKAKPVSNTRGLISCITVIIAGFAMFFLLFYAMLKNS